MENGGNNPPIPEVLGEPATGATFSSTASHSLDVPAIGGRPAATIEGPRHANVSPDDIMAYVKSQHISLRNVTWSTSQLPGTLLMSIPITPLRANSVVAYLSGIFNAWNGGLEYQAKVAGTGFHAGSIGIARIPPNIDPKTLQTKEQFTVFEYSVIDPKTLEAFSKHIPDQRPIMYHYMSDDFTDPNNIGGYFVIFVIQQLNTSSTGTNQIDIEVFNKLAPDFRFIQVVPPTLPNQPIVDPDKWSTLFSIPNLHSSALFDMPITAMRIEAAGTVSNARTGMVNLAGEVYGDPPYTTLISNPLLGRGYPFFSTTATSMIPTIGDNVLRPFSFTVANTGAVFRRVPVPSNVNAPASVSFGASNAVTGAVVSSSYYFTPNLTNVCTATYGTTPNIVPRIGESLVTFSYGTSAVVTPFTLTTTFLAEQFLTTRYEIGPNEAVLCKLFNRQTGLPVAYIKIYFEGYMTSNAQVSAVTLDFPDLELVFDSFIGANQIMPPLTQEMRNSLFANDLKALVKEARKLHLHD